MTYLPYHHSDAFFFEVHGFVWGLSDQSWALKAELWMQCWGWKSYGSVSRHCQGFAAISCGLGVGVHSGRILCRKDVLALVSWCSWLWQPVPLIMISMTCAWQDILHVWLCAVKCMVMVATGDKLSAWSWKVLIQLLAWQCGTYGLMYTTISCSQQM